MLRHYLLLAFRQILKNKLFILVNISGLAVAIACCTVAYYLYDFNATFDGHHAQAQSIYRVSSIRTFQNSLSKYGHAPMALGTALRNGAGEPDKVVRDVTDRITTRANELTFSENVAYTDPEFFELFTFEALDGTLSLQRKSAIVISDELARKYFGSTNAAGKELVQLVGEGKQKLYTVAGVFKRPPNNSSFTLQAYVHFDNQADDNPKFDENDWAPRAAVYVGLPDRSRVEPLQTELLKFKEANNLAREDFLIDRFVLEPLPGLARQDSYQNTRGVWTNSAAHISAVVGTAAMGILILLIACFNLTNTAIAVSSGRLKEIGMRKVMGSGRHQVIGQYFGEVFLVCLLAMALGLLLADRVLIPAFNSLWTFWSFTPDYFGKPDYLVFLLLVLVLTSVLAGSYPAFHISRFQPVQILRGKVKFGGTNAFTRTLLTLQLTISMIAVVCSLAFVGNANYQKTLDMGFNKDEVLFLEVRGALEADALKNRLAQLPDVLSVAPTHHHIGSSYINDPVTSGATEREVDILDVGDDYLRTAGITLVAGRDFITDSETDKRHSVIITENMAKAFGWTEPVGQELVWMDTVHYQVVGVVKDIVNKGMMSRMDPVMLRYKGKEDVRFCVVRAPSDKIVAVKEKVEAEARNLFPDRLVTVKYMNELIANSIQINNSILKMFAFLGIVATLLSATGLYTLTSLNIVKRMKEIGVRKVLGASGGNIARIINTQLAVILGIASVFGGYLGAQVSGLLLDSIWEHFQRATVATILLSVAALAAVAAMSIAYKVISTIRVNPTTILRSE